jgi:glycosyltransferase 2 family protein
VLVAAALTAGVFWKSHPSQVLAATAGAEWRPIGMAILLVLVDRSLMAYRWLVLLRPFAGPDGPRLGVVMRIFFVSTFVGTFLPASVGGDAVRAIALSRHNVSGSGAVASVLMDRMLGVLSLLLMAVVGLFLAQQVAFHPLVLASLGVTTVACALAAVVVFSSRAEAVLRMVCDRLPWERVRQLGVRLIEAMQRYATRRGDLVNVLAGSIGVQLLRIVQAYYLGLALGITAPITTYFAFVPLILLVMLLPVTINGLGTSQAAFVWFFAQAGVGRPEAFALSVLFVALGVVGNLPGGLLYATGGMISDRQDRPPA